MIDKELLAILACPENHMPLSVADEALLARLNSAIRAGQVRNKVGEPVTDPLTGGLVREDGAVLYPIRDGIPILLVDEAIPVSEVK
jgi:uncharacterized protein YbaR (Trm112 family)